MQELAPAVQPRFLEGVDAAAEDHLLGRDVQVHARGIVPLAPLPEERRRVCLVRPLVAGEADVPIQAVQAAAHARHEDQSRHDVVKPLREPAAPLEHGGDDLVVPGHPVCLEPVAIVVLGQIAQEGEAALGEALERHQRGQFRRRLR